MLPPRPYIVIPGWVRWPSGLILPSSVTPPPPAEPVPSELAPPARPSIVVSRMPSSFDQMHPYVDEAALGLELSTADEQRKRVSLLPFETTAVVLAKLATHADHVRHDAGRQLELAHALYGQTPAWPRLAAHVRNREMQAFAEQHFIALLRLLVLHATDEPLTERLSDLDWVLMSRALIAMGTVNDAGLSEDRAADGWLAYLVQNGAYNHHEPALEAMARAYTIFSTIHELPELREHPDRVPVDAWLRERTNGLGLDQQFALGIALLSSARALDGDLLANDRGVVARERVEDLAARIGAPTEAVLNAISADRAWYRREFARCDDAGAAWDRVPFEQRPFLRISDGRLALWHSRCLMSWLTEGVHYRLLDVARRHRKVSRYTRYLGALTERYALEVMRDAHPGPRPLGVGLVHAEQPYGGRSRAEKRTSDIAIDYGTDLVLVEVCSRRLTLKARRGGDPHTVHVDLDRMLGEKLEQLGARTADLLAGDAALPDVNVDEVRRVWPIVVTGPGLLESEMLWNYIDEHTATLRSLARVQPVTLLDLCDLEQLAGLIETGQGLVDLLERKTTGPYARIDLRRFVFEDPHLSAPDPVHRTLVGERGDHATAA